MNIFGTSFDYQKRLGKIRNLMDGCDIDAMLVHLWTNQYYISGMYHHLPWYPLDGPGGSSELPLVVFRDKKVDPIFLTVSLVSASVKEGTWIRDVRVLDKEPYGKLRGLEYMAEFLKENGVDGGKIAIEECTVVVSTFRKLQSLLPKAQFRSAEEILLFARMVKEPEEVELIKESVSIAEAGVKAGMETAKVGATESEVQQAAEMEMKRRGAIREVETMAQSGLRTVNGRAFGSNWNRIKENDIFIMDIGCSYKGYGSDITRTWAVGKPTKTQKKIANDLARIREKILAFMKPGVPPREIVDLAKNELKNAGYPTDQKSVPSNGIGMGRTNIHGIGVGPFHDLPKPWDPGRVPELEIGMTLALNLSVRHEEFAIKYEDNLLVVPEGVEVMSKLIPWDL